MNYEKNEVGPIGSRFFCSDCYLLSKNIEYKNKEKLQCVLYKKTSSATYFEFDKFFFTRKHNHPKSFAEIEETTIEARIKNESEK